MNRTDSYGWMREEVGGYELKDQMGKEWERRQREAIQGIAAKTKSHLRGHIEN